MTGPAVIMDAKGRPMTEEDIEAVRSIYREVREDLRQRGWEVINKFFTLPGKVGTCICPCKL